MKIISETTKIPADLTKKRLEDVCFLSDESGNIKKNWSF